MSMKRNNIPYRQDLLYHLSTLPKNIVSFYNQDNITEFVLHDLCNKNCFNIEKAAYFVDSPDFDHCKGIAGFYQKELCPLNDIWADPCGFSEYMKSAAFNNQVRSIVRPSVKKNGEHWKTTAFSLANELAIQEPSLYIFDLKHDNHGIFLCNKLDDEYDQDDMRNWLTVLGLCPIN